MKSRPPDPRKLDVAAAAAQALTLEGRWPMAGFRRLQQDAPAAVEPAGVAWSARGQQRPVSGGEPETWLHLAAHARVWRECQRCLLPVELEVEVIRALRFVPDEATAEALDAESEDDVLALPRSLDLHELIEDELLLALPLVPMHASCPEPPPMSSGPGESDDVPEPADSPFAVLERLKRGRPN